MNNKKNISTKENFRAHENDSKEPIKNLQVLNCLTQVPQSIFFYEHSCCEAVEYSPNPMLSAHMLPNISLTASRILKPGYEYEPVLKKTPLKNIKINELSLKQLKKIPFLLVFNYLNRWRSKRIQFYQHSLGRAKAFLPNNLVKHKQISQPIVKNKDRIKDNEIQMIRFLVQNRHLNSSLSWLIQKYWFFILIKNLYFFTSTLAKQNRHPSRIFFYLTSRKMYKQTNVAYTEQKGSLIPHKLATANVQQSSVSKQLFLKLLNLNLFIYQDWVFFSRRSKTKIKKEIFFLYTKKKICHYSNLYSNYSKSFLFTSFCDLSFSDVNRKTYIQHKSKADYFYLSRLKNYNNLILCTRFMNMNKSSNFSKKLYYVFPKIINKEKSFLLRLCSAS